MTLLALAVAVTVVPLALLLLLEKPFPTIARIPNQPPISVVVQWPEESANFW